MAVNKDKSNNLPRKSRLGQTKGLAGAPLIRVERAGGELRSGMPVVLNGPDGAALIMSAETLEPVRITELLPLVKQARPNLLLSPTRAAALKIRLYTPGVAIVPLASEIDTILAMRELADPALDLKNPMRGPFNAQRENAPGVAAASLALLKHATLLPAAIAWFLAAKDAGRLARALDLVSVTVAEIHAYASSAARDMSVVTAANLPLAGAENTRVLAFRPKSGAREHLALLIGAPSPANAPLVRLHSECLTGDLLGSLKCDCGDQLRGAIAKIGQDPAGGVLLYLAQEGRGIGLVNKLRAYSLQDQGFDTIDANTRLGFDADERAFTAAATMLKHLGFETIRLLTNNPDKVAGLENEGVKVIERVAHAFPVNPHNADYLRVKAAKAGHLL